MAGKLQIKLSGVDVYVEGDIGDAEALSVADFVDGLQFIDPRTGWSVELDTGEARISLVPEVPEEEE